MWKQQITTNVNLVFTLYILSVYTHKMYMIGMHIIFLLTENSFNKALCQSTVICRRVHFVAKNTFLQPSELLVQVKSK